LELQSLSFVKKKVSARMVQSVLSGILVGIGASIVLVLIGLPIYLSEYMVFLLPISILLAIVNFRYLCFSYAGGILGFLTLVFNGQMLLGYKLPDIDLDIPGIIALVGILHLMEAGLIFIEGSKDSIPIAIKKEGKIAAAYMMQKYWPLPFALLVIEIVTSLPNGTIEMPDWWPLMKNIMDNQNTILIYSIYPIAAVLGYGDIAVTTSPEKKSRRNSLLLMLYSLILIFTAILAPNRQWMQVMGIILMPLLHEILIVQSQRRERFSKPLYMYPDKGVRILELKPESIGERIGLKRGDIISKINGTPIRDYIHLRAVLNNYYTFLWFDIITPSGEKKYLEHRAYPEGINELGIIPLMDQPITVYRLENMESIGLFNMMKK